MNKKRMSILTSAAIVFGTCTWLVVSHGRAASIAVAPGECGRAIVRKKPEPLP